MKKVLFLAPGYLYAKTVIRNTSNDLHRSNIPFTASSDSRNMYIRTNNVDVTFNCDDPVTWTGETFRGIDAIYGKKELINRLRELDPFILCHGELSFIEYVKKYAESDRPGNSTEDIPARTQYIPEISKVYFNDPTTVVLWSDGTKTIVTCQRGDIYSEEVGLALCISKKALGNKGNFNKVFDKWLPEPKPKTTTVLISSMADCSLSASTDDATIFIDKLISALKGEI